MGLQTKPSIGSSKRRLHLRVTLLTACLLAIANKPSIAAPASQPPDMVWRTEIVDSKLRLDSAMVLDDSGLPHIAYEAQGFSSVDLKYAHWTGSQWLLQRVADMGFGGSTAIALDRNAGPQISYSVCNPFYCEPRYAEWTGSAWVNTIPPEGHGPLVIDTNGDPHTSYSYGNVVGSISQRYAHRVGGNWITATIESGFQNGTFSSLQLDKQGNPHISYYGAGYLTYAYLAGNSWITQVVESDYYAGLYTSLALDANDQPHISYYDFNSGDLRYAVWTGSQWITQTVDSEGDVGTHPSLRLDSTGYPHISYYDVTNQAIKYARWTGSYWRIYVVDTGVGDGLPISLALDQTDQPRIAYSYYTPESRGLKFAWGELRKVIYFPTISHQ